MNSSINEETQKKEKEIVEEEWGEANLAPQFQNDYVNWSTHDGSLNTN